MQAAERRRARWCTTSMVLLVLELSATASSSAHEQLTGFNLKEPAPGIFLHVGRHLPLDAPGHEDIANIGFIVGERCVAIIDSGGSVAIGRALRAAAKRRSSLPICYVINTHVHVDHVLGNAAFLIDRPSFIGSAMLAEAIARSSALFVKEYGGDMDSPPSAAQVIGPDRRVDRDLTLDLGHRQLLLQAWPTAHTDCDLSIFDLQTGTLWTGDLLFRERLPALDGSVKGWLAAIDVLSKKKVKLAVPGHGEVTRDLPAALAAERRYLQALVDGVRAELAAAEPIEDAIDRVASEQRTDWLLWDNTHPHNVVRAYEELEWE